MLFLVAALLAAQAAVAAPRPMALRAGLVIDRSVTIRPGVYRLPSASVTEPLLVVRGHDLVVDFAGAELAGAPDDAAPDQFAGLAVLVDGGERITIRNARIRGYKVAILARGVRDLRLSNNDVSGNWKQHLYSRVERESLVDWMSYHDNEQNQWLRYGAGLYLDRVDGGDIDRNRATGGQNGLMVARSRALKIWNNDFSYLSGVGLGLYRTSDSTIMHNRIDWCVRGYSHGFYNRGQDSAGLLMYEQSSRNLVAYNSITHGGDGLFLWAGQSTMDSGEGGANDNLFYGNDFSHAPANGIETTFSRNRFVANRIEENWHGVWGGYSFDSLFAGNTFAGNQEAIAIEHGQHNTIEDNTFSRDGIAIRLWQNPRQDPNWGYPKHRDTRSRDYVIAGNRFADHTVALDLTATSGVVVRGNTFERVQTLAALKTDAPGFRIDESPAPPREQIVPPPRMPGGVDAMIPDGARRGRQYIIVDDWGPYDWRTPKLWPAARSDESPLRLRVLGPAGSWSLESARGATVSPQSGTVPGELTVTPDRQRLVDFRVDLRYAGEHPAVFGYARFFAPIDWTVRFFDFSKTMDAPLDDRRFAGVVAGTPVKIDRVDRLDYLSSRAIADGVPADYVAVAADGEVQLPDGDYELRVIADDGVRVWVDGALAIDDWVAHESAVDRAPLRGGRHRLRVEYFENTGFAELRVEVIASGKPPRGVGDPAGPRP
jgi:nitrous oxidase accessory protein NosD